MIKKYFSKILLLISISLFLYTFYRSEIFNQGNYREAYKIYYILSLILLFFSILTFYLSNKINSYLIIVTISSVFSFYIFEIYLTYLDIKNDKQDRLELYQDLKKKDRNHVITASPINFVNDKSNTFPLSGVSNSKTIHCNESGFFSIYNSDRYGFNNPDSSWDKDIIHFLLVGDSFVHGSCVNRPNDITSNLRKLSNKNALNLGYGGNGPLLEYITLREYLNDNIENIIWFFYEGNDLQELVNENKISFLKRYLKDINFSQKLRYKQSKIDDLVNKRIENESKKYIRKTKQEEFINNIIEVITIFKIRKLINSENYFKVKNNYKVEIPKNFEKILNLTKDLANSKNAKLYFVYLPSYARYKIKNHISNLDKVKGIIENLDITFIDIHEDVFSKEINPLNLFAKKENSHYNEIGYAKIAEKLYKTLMTQN